MSTAAMLEVEDGVAAPAPAPAVDVADAVVPPASAPAAPAPASWVARSDGRVRAGALAIIAAGALAPGTAFLVSEVGGDSPFLWIPFISLMLVTPVAGLALLVVAGVRRSAADVRALMAAGLSMVAGVAWLIASEPLGEEWALDRRAAGAEAMVREVLAREPEVARAIAADPARRGASAEEVRRAVNDALSDDLRGRRLDPTMEVHTAFVRVYPGLLYVRTHLPPTDELRQALNCERRPGLTLRFRGGRWYSFSCGGEDEYN